MQFTKDSANKQIRISRSYNASLQLVWDSYTKSEILDKWWAPLPYKNKTKSQDFREGGKWLYCMISPKNEVHWCILFYLKINKLKNFEAKDSFCDENGVLSPGIPSMHWNNEFSQDGKITTLHVTITFASEADLETIIQMGFKEGFEMGLNQLGLILDTH